MEDHHSYSRIGRALVRHDTRHGEVAVKTLEQLPVIGEQLAYTQLYFVALAVVTIAGWMIGWSL
jgi:hypothetical protein